MTVEQLIQKIEKITSEIDSIKGVYEHLAGTDKLIEHRLTEAMVQLGDARYYMLEFAKEEDKKFDSVEFEKHIPREMRFKEFSVVDKGCLYWVTQEFFSVEQLYEFQQALKEHGGKYKKAYVTVRDLSGYDFEEDRKNKVLATVTPSRVSSNNYYKVAVNYLLN